VKNIFLTEKIPKERRQRHEQKSEYNFFWKNFKAKTLYRNKAASYPGAMCCSMACVAFAWAAWINLIDFEFSVFLPRVLSHVRLMSYIYETNQSAWVRGWK
jgi:hypothetical protein